MKSKKKQVYSLLKGIETGDPKAVLAVNEDKYIQHNPLTKTGNIGLAELFKRLSTMNPKVELVRIFEDGNFVFAHTDYDFNVLEVGFEVFRFEDGFIVEHWDNLELKPKSPNLSSHTMIDGSTKITDVEKTEENRRLVESFVSEVLIEKKINKISLYIHSKEYIEHNKNMSDGLNALTTNLTLNQEQRDYKTVHRVLAEGNFVLCVTEGFLNKVHVSFYDLFRISNGLIVEHWDTIDNVPAKSEWVNDNGKF